MRRIVMSRGQVSNKPKQMATFFKAGRVTATSPVLSVEHRSSPTLLGSVVLVADCH
jgi:hypothetical protein